MTGREPRFAALYESVAFESHYDQADGTTTEFPVGTLVRVEPGPEGQVWVTAPNGRTKLVPSRVVISYSEPES